jgi:nitroimidazol reductase NimA-like FMN-containing flavoprotein (pyridoxamine 5'-phosphate oxidase superfamily)
MADGSADQATAGPGPWTRHPTVEQLDESECRSLLAQYEVGRIAYSGRFGLTVLPVNYRWHDGAIYFRTGADSPMGEDLRTGIAHADYQVAFEVDEVDTEAREGWSVLVQGAAHHLDSAEERDVAEAARVEPWPGGHKDHFIRIIPGRITGRRIRPAGSPAAT